MTRRSAFSCAALLLALTALRAAEPEQDGGPGEEIVVAATPGDCPQFRRTVERMLKASPKGHKVRLTIVRVLDMNVGTRHLRRLKCAVPIDPQGRPDGTEEHRAVPHHPHVERTVPYKKGVREGTEQVWAAKNDRGDRYVRAEVPWHNDKILGTRKTFHPNGKASSTTEYVDGRPHGAVRTFSLDGTLTRSGTMRNGKRHGPMTEYWGRTGNAKRIIPYVAGKVTGVVKEYYANGKLKRELSFRDDLMHGIEKQYEVDGKLARTRYWLDGDVVPEKEFKRRSGK